MAARKSLRRAARHGRGPVAVWQTVSLVVLTVVGIAKAMSSSDTAGIEHRLIGHPKERFPLTIYAEPAPTKSLSSVIQDAVAQWNEVFEQVFHVAAFTWSDNQAGAELLIRFAKESSVRHEMSEPTSTLMSAALFVCR